MTKKIAIIHHGCAKNLVDSELMLGLLDKKGYKITLDPYEEDVYKVIINTCSFIFDAEKESVKSIFDMINAGKNVIITGCLVQKHQAELKALIAEAKGFLGTCDIKNIVDAIENDNYFKVSENPCYIYPEDINRMQITVGSSSYIKIAEGCNYACGYCVIPSLRGKYVSRPVENIVKEAKLLANKGVSEIILIAQDTSCYGIDLYKKPSLDILLKKLNDIDNLNWIRVLYTYPTNFTEQLFDAFNSLDKVVKYVDVPLQHSHPDILKAMNRPVIDSLAFVNKLRDKIKNVSIRTTLITGYPTESQAHFECMYNFVREARFDRLGVFEFSREKGTPSYSMKPQVAAKVKKHRKNEILKLQKNISNSINESLVGKKIPCIIEQIRSDGLITARSYKDAPDVDGLVYLKTDKVLVPGDIEDVLVTGYTDYDIFGEI